jgi:diaminohydroxyphosphoribosylaminopyrimidine deaminase/5-amino-6-(5-phosphoribosylamino)uracil reductase
MAHDPLDAFWMRRCLDLAARGHGRVSPNPAVGAVLVHDGRLIGEGWHRRFGGPHAEVEAVASVTDADRPLIPRSTLYVSLEPCCITGKTPPCTDLIIRERIPRVVIGATDPNPLVAGRGKAILRQHGIEVIAGVMADAAAAVIRPFAVNILGKRPYVTLKWAQSRLGYYAPAAGRQWLSEPETQAWSHRLRAENDAILAGARTILMDDPSLTTRAFPGRSPQRVIYDPSGKVPGTCAAFADDGIGVFLASEKSRQPDLPGHVVFIPLHRGESHCPTILHVLFEHGIGRVLVEGGAHVQKMFIRENLWDEAWVIRTRSGLAEGIEAPQVRGRLAGRIKSGTDEILGIYRED